MTENNNSGATSSEATQHSTAPGQQPGRAGQSADQTAPASHSGTGGPGDESSSTPIQGEQTAEPTTRNAEAARYRHRLRDVEAERDQLREDLTKMQTEQTAAERTRIADEHGIPDKFRHLLTADDAEGVTEQAKTLAELMDAKIEAFASNEGQGRAAGGGEPEASWDSFLKRR